MPRRKVAFCNDHFYHVYSKSIEKFEIFRFETEYKRVLAAIFFYRYERVGCDLAHYLRELPAVRRDEPGALLVRIIAYCIMPTHIHLLFQQKAQNGIPRFMHRVMGSYATYFNKKIKRKGPLWEGRFGARRVETDEDLLHMTRYIHLNPSSAGLVDKPEDWEFSSFHEHLGMADDEHLCDLRNILSMSPEAVRRFTQDRADYQRSLQTIKNLILD